MQVSVSFLPAVFIFFLIAGCFQGTKEIHLLYFVFSIVALGTAAGLFWDFWTHKNMVPSDWISSTGSTLFIVKNDVAFLSVITPFLLSLIWLKPRSIVGVIAALALILNLTVVGVFQSRVAMLSMVISVMCFFSLMRLRIGLACGLLTFISILLIDSFMGFPLIERFIRFWDGTGRVPLWLSAWEMFLDKPFWGHGPHTFVLFYNSYLQDLSLPSWLFVDRRIVPWPHNLYLEVLSEQGIIGIAALVSLLAGGLLKGWGFRKAASSELKVLGCGAFAGLISFCFAALIELTFLRQWVVLTLFILLGVISKLSISKDFVNERQA
jgi:O-antigen ligase